MKRRVILEVEIDVEIPDDVCTQEFFDDTKRVLFQISSWDDVFSHIAKEITTDHFPDHVDGVGDKDEQWSACPVFCKASVER